MKNNRWIMAVVACGAIPPAVADAVLDWNATAETAAVAAGGPPLRNRIVAMSQVAVHDALNAIAPRFETYLPMPAARAGASLDAAVGAAAYRVLLHEVPSQAASLTATYAARLAALPSCPGAFPDCVEDGIAAGEAAALAILADRVGDGSANPHRPYTLAPGPGVYQPTPPANAPPQFAGFATLKPFALRYGAQFRADPSPIFDLAGEAYTRDFNEVKRVGNVNAEALGDRTPEQSGIARFWPGGGAAVNGAVARVIVAGRGLDLHEHGRLFAVVSMAVNDSAIAAYDSKYTYNFWRPITAIRNADIDGNANTTADAGWVPYLPTPPYPDYTCNLPNNVGSGLAAMRLVLGTDDVPFTFTAAGLPPAVTRSFTTLSQAASESADARVLAGIHFRDGCLRGLKQGEQVARFTYEHYLKPLKGRGKGG